MIPLPDIRAAAARVAGTVHRTPVLSARSIGDRAGVELHLKCECFQKTGSFKPRGALNKVLSLADADRARGLVTVSAGNHAQAVAWAARRVGAPCVVVMPTAAPRSKLDAVRGYGAQIVLHDDRATLFDFDDPTVLAGAGTVGLELLDDVPAPDVVIVPVGGGGLLGGVASAVRALAPRARIVAVELEAGPGLGPALAAGKPVPAPRPDTIADGMTPPFVGELPLAIARDAAVEVVTVTEAEIIEAMRLLMTRAKLYVEGSGAAATAALVAGKVVAPAGARVVAIVSGGNIDPDRALGALVER
ncbi:MAG: threonine/serine dehydratase [Deltaproteobacteria bacterium]|nr:MAG: threonine/serine dehydratase [Deltaproteobacteria bacterium]